MATTVPPASNGQKTTISTSTPARLTEPSNGRTSFSEPEPESKLARAKPGDRGGSYEFVEIHTVWQIESVGQNEKRKEKTSHYLRDEALIAGHLIDASGKSIKIESRVALKLEDGRCIYSDGIPLQMGTDQKEIAKLRGDQFAALPEVTRILIEKYKKDGSYITTPSES